MSYIWINPVIDSMYDAYVLDDFLRRYGHKRIEVSEDWGKVVKEKYWKAVCQADRTVADVRCPKVKDLLEKMSDKDKMLIPDINPILIHCGQEIGGRAELKGMEKIITTPCQALADMGNRMGLENTRFIPWNEFVQKTGECPEEKGLEESPIPPGFFSELMLETVSVTGEEEIKEYLENGNLDDIHLLEMLFCKDGCHNGDGVKPCES